MSQSRTLLRRRRESNLRTRLDDEGHPETYSYVRMKPHSLNRRILKEWRVGDYLHSVHATKGARVVRQPA